MSTKEKEENNIQFLTSQIADGCIECGKCIDKCPYDLPINDRIKESAGYAGALISKKG